MSLKKSLLQLWFGALMSVVLLVPVAAEVVVPGKVREAGALPKVLAVQFRGVDSRWKYEGFNEAKLREAVEAKLRAAGIEVLTPEAALTRADAVFMDIEPTVNDATFYYSFLVMLKLRAKLALPNNPEGFVTRTVWSDWRLGGIERYHLERLHDHVLSLTDELLGRQAVASTR